MPKFTNLDAKRGISVNLPRLCEVGLPGPKARAEINMFKEPVVQQMPDQFTESQSKSYIARGNSTRIIKCTVTVILKNMLC